MSKLLQVSTQEQKKAIEFLLNQNKIKYNTSYDRAKKIHTVEVLAQAKSIRSVYHLSKLIQATVSSTKAMPNHPTKPKKEYKANPNFKNIKVSTVDVVKIAKDTFRLEHKGELLEVVGSQCLEVCKNQWAKRLI